MDWTLNSTYDDTVINDYVSKIASLFEERIGLNVNELSISGWRRCLSLRMTDTGYRDLEKYYKLLKVSSEEFMALVELVVVPETWFFRNSSSYDLAISLIREHLNLHSGQTLFNILCIPCSSGEEPYSLVMALMDANIPLTSIHIDAMDISEKAIALAKLGVYGSKSFRSRQVSFVDRYFTRTDAGAKIDDSIKKHVSFYKKNICSDELLDSHVKYDVIFCRNLFIYLSSRAQKKALENFSALLKSDRGVLFVSPSELEICKKNGWHPIGELNHYALQQNVSASQVESENRVSETQDVDSQSLVLLEPLATKDSISIEEASRKADEGDFHGALNICLGYIKDKGLTDPLGYFLTGLIYHALGDQDSAEGYFEKAVYLKPDYLEALFYLALLEESKGNFQKAQVIRKRIERINHG